MTKWTNEQLDAINKTGTNIIVSAGAGSGKTTVLTERVITKLKAGIKINELLILTFTNNSAHDMQEKIKKAITNNEKLNDGTNDLESAYIMTFDAFVLSLVKKHHHYLNLDKDVNIIDHSIIILKKKEIIQEIFTSKYQENDEKFIKLVTDFCSKNDKYLQQIILELDNNLNLLIKKEDYLNNYINEFYKEDHLNNLFNNYLDLIFDKINLLKDCLHSLSFEVDGDYYNTVYDLLLPIFNADTYEKIKTISNIKIPNLPRGSSDDAKEYKAEMKKISDDIILYTSEEKIDLIDEIMNTKDYLEILIDILLTLDKKINQYKRNYNSFEFGDISQFAIKLLEDNPDISNDLKYHFKEIMIDEYQDTNDVQETFISLIENNNVYMVGDIKQSIYRFRNANPSIFKNKYDSYKNEIHGIKIDLNKNFRSRHEVIDPINNIFNCVMDDKIGSANYSAEHQMIFGNESYNVESPDDYNLTIYNYEDDKNHSKEEIEAFIIAKDIKNKIENKYKVLKKDGLRNCSYSDFCILMDRSSSFDTYKKVFDYMQIPLNIYKDDNILLNDETFLVKNILSLILKIKKKEYDQDFKLCFTSIARSYLFEMSDEEIFLKIKNNEIFKTEIFKKCQNISENIDYISNKSLLNIIIEEFDFYLKMIKVGNVNDRNIVLNNLLSKAEELNKVEIDVFGLEEYFNILLDTNSEIKVPAVLSSSDSVVITNIHKSKGLEYHICYFSGLYKKFNLRDSFEKIIFTKDFGFILPTYKDGLKNTFLSTLFTEKYIEDEISEKVRLFYVALTRCKEKIIFVTPFSEKKINYNDEKFVDYLTRISYRSFLDILSSVYMKIEDKIINLDSINIPNNYLFNKKIDLKNYKEDKELLVNSIDIKKEIINKANYSKTIKNLVSAEENKNIERGNKLHYILENIDFLCPNYNNLNSDEIDVVNSFLTHPIMKNISNSTIIKEHEFQTNVDGIQKTGIIDLLVVYDTHVDIIDYKLKYVEDEDYKLQLNGYKKYIEEKTNKKTFTYLYSLIDKKLIKID